MINPPIVILAIAILLLVIVRQRERHPSFTVRSRGEDPKWFTWADEPVDLPGVSVKTAIDLVLAAGFRDLPTIRHLTGMNLNSGDMYALGYKDRLMGWVTAEEAEALDDAYSDWADDLEPHPHVEVFEVSVAEQIAPVMTYVRPVPLRAERRPARDRRQDDQHDADDREHLADDLLRAEHRDSEADEGEDDPEDEHGY